MLVDIDEESPILTGMSQISRVEGQNLEKNHWLRSSFCVVNLIHTQIHCNIVNHKINLKHNAFYSLKDPEIHYLMNTLKTLETYWIVA